MPDNESLSVRSDDIKRLADLVEKNGLSELRYEQGDLRITLRTAAYRPAAPLTPAAMPVIGSVFADDAPYEDAPLVTEVGSAEGAPLTDGVSIEAPIMGVFYRAAKPDDPPFVEVGDSVEVGQVIGLIEAMKTFSEVEAEAAGIVQAIAAQNGTLVQPGDALIILKP